MNFLLCNDEGVCSTGITALAERLKCKHNVLVVAPEKNMSACSHSLSIRKNLKLKELINLDNYKVYSLSGTPVDCVKFANLNFSNFNADVVVAGINKGHNLGSDILYSGTVAIGYEATFFKKIAFCFSVFSLTEENFDEYAIYAEKIIDLLLPFSEIGVIWNVNFPKTSFSQIKGIKITKLGEQLYTDYYQKVSENEYVLDGELVDHDNNDQDTDVESVKNGYISVTPILFDKTCYKKIKEVKDLCERLSL